MHDITNPWDLSLIESALKIIKKILDVHNQLQGKHFHPTAWKVVSFVVLKKVLNQQCQQAA